MSGRWKLNLYTLWVSQILSLMSFSFGLPFLPFYIQQLGVTEPDKIKLFTGLISATPAIGMAIMAPIWGSLADRYGKKLMLLRAMLAASVIITLMGMVVNPMQLVYLRLLQGVFTGTVTAAAALVASSSPSNKLSFSLGLMASSTFIGNSLGPVIGSFIANGFGYRYSFYIGGALMFMDFLLVLFLVKDRKPDYRPRVKNEVVLGMKSIISPMLLHLLLTLFIIRITRTVFSPYMPLMVQSYESTNYVSYTGYINGLIGFMTAFSGIAISAMGDRKDKVKLMKMLLMLSAAVASTLIFTKSLLVFAGFYALLFLFSGGIEPLVMSMTALSVPPEKRGVLFGMQATVGSIGFAISPMIGAFVSINFSLHAVLAVIPLLTLINLYSVKYLGKRGVPDENQKT